MTISVKRPQRPQSRVGGLVAMLIAFAFVGLVGSCLITIAIWPGQIKLLAPIFCTDAQPDPFVVSDTYSPRPGETVTDFTLYCMGERGDSTDHGFLRPFLLISVVNGVAIFAIGFVLTVLSGFLAALRQRSRTADHTTAHVTGPPDDDRDDDRDDDDDDPFGPPSGPSRPPTGSTAGPFVN